MQPMDRIPQYKKLFDSYYISKITGNIRQGKRRVTIEFNDISRFNPELAEDLITDPEESLKAAELAIKEMDLFEDDTSAIRVRVRGDIPNSKLRIRDLRGKHLSRFITLEGTIETKTDVGLRAMATKYECPSCGNIINVLQFGEMLNEPDKCLPKGTLIQTPSGLKPIEKVKEVLCLDYGGKLVKEKAKLVPSGVLTVYKINDEIECSENHMWYVVREGRCRYLPTKDLYSSDVLLMIDENNLHYLSEGIRTRNESKEENRPRQIQSGILREQNMFGRVSKETINTLPEKTLQGRCRHSENIRYVHQSKNGCQGHSPNNIGQQKSSINKIKGQQYNSQVIPRTIDNRHKIREENISYRGIKSILQEWRKMWGRILQEDGEGEPNRRMSLLRNKRKIDSSSQRFKSSKSFNRQSDSYVQFMPYEISRIVKTNKKVEMYDLQVLDYNNFIININHKNILSHNCGCGRKGRFNLINQDIIDCFTLRLQELSSNIKYGSSMAMISVLCNDDLADTIIEERLIEGIKVKINGIYKSKWVMKGGAKSTHMVTYIEANYIHISDESFVDLEITEKDKEEIYNFSKQPDLIKKIYTGLFQGVHGYDKIKEALVLQAFGGVSNYQTIPNIRGDIHILLVGDPGENKSVFLEFASSFNPKSILVVGKSVSAVGMSGAVIKDELSGSYVLKIGAIPLANNGLLAIDELDKMKEEDRDILHEPMEQQRISISKANLPDRRMLSRASFLVSMNPKNSYFNNIDPVYTQIALPSTLVSRFCLVFIMKKKRDKDDITRNDEKEKARIMMTRHEESKQKKLRDFHNFMRKYIGYAKQNIFPKFDKYLSEEYLPDKYAGFDQENKSHLEEGDTFPITPRFLNVIKRLSEARARIFLRDRVLIEDVDYAIEKIKGSLEDIAIDKKTGRIDQDWVIDGVSSKRKKLIDIFDVVCDRIQNDNGDIILDDFYNEMAKEGIEGRELEEFLYKKNSYGDIIYPHGIRGGKMRRE